MAEAVVSPFAGAGILDSGSGLISSLNNKDWVGASLCAVGVAVDAVAFALNPIAGLVSMGVGWLLDHVEPLKSWLNELTGNAAEVMSGSQSWQQIAAQLATASEDLLRSLRVTLAEMQSQAVDTYKVLMSDAAAHVGMANQLAAAISGGLSVASGLVQFVHDLVRDALADIVGLAVSLVVPLPSTIASVVAKVGKWVARIGTHIDDLVDSFVKLKSLFHQADGLMAKLRTIFDSIRSGVRHSDDVPTTTPKPHSSTPDGPPGNPKNPAHGSEPSTRCNGVGEPVDAATGFVFFRRVDVELPGALPLVLQRRYVSGFTAGRWFGKRWASTLDEHLDTAEGRLTLVRADGSTLLYPMLDEGMSAEPLEAADRWLLRRTGADQFSATDPVTGTTTLFAGAGRRKWVVEHRDRTGAWIRYQRDPSGMPTAVVHEGGYQVGITNNGTRITGMDVLGAGPAGEPLPAVRFDYAQGRLVSETSGTGVTVHYEVDEVDRVVTWVDANNVAYTHRYDELDRCVHEGPADPTDAIYRFSYAYEPGPAAGGHTTVITNPDHTQLRYEIDQRGLLLASTDPLGARTEYVYDDRCRKTAVIDPLGQVTAYEWDDDSRLISVSGPDGATSVVTYDPAGLPVRVVDPTGAVTVQKFDERGRLVERIDPTGAVETWAHDDQLRQVVFTDAVGRQSLLVKDAAGLVIEARDAAGVSTVERDVRGLPVSVVDATGANTRYEWSAAGRLARQVNPDGTEQRWAWDGQGNLVAETDAAARTTRYAYAAFDVVDSITAPDGSVLRLGYDNERRLVSVTNQLGAVWRYERDAAGRVVAEVDYDGRETRFELDAAGRTVAVINPAGERVDLVLDAAGRMVGRQVAGHVDSFGYDLAGRLVSATTPGAELARELDPAGRLVSESVNGASVRWGMDASGRVVERVTPSGVVSDWTLDAAGRRAGLELAGHGVRFGLDAAGRAAVTEFAGGRIESGFDVMGRLTSRQVVGGQEWQVAYGYTAAGELATVQDSVAGRRQLELDGAGRITAVSGDRVSERYAYDATGNITQARWASGGEAQGDRQYAGSLLVEAGRDRYAYDAAGRMVSRTRRLLSGGEKVWRFTWNGLDQLTGLVDPAGHRWSYAYDGLNRRVAKTHCDAAGVVVESWRFVWDGAVLVEQSHDVAGVVTSTTWEHDGFTPVAQARSRSQSEFDAEFAAIITDLVGTPVRVQDSAGRTVWTSQASTWGATDADAAMPLRFPGQYHDTESGLFYNLNRYYNPDTARYVTADPLGLAPSPNPHAYVPNPTTQIDPLGLAAEPHGPHQGPDGPGRWMSPQAFAQALIREVRNSFRGSPTESGRHDQGYRMSASTLRQLADSGGFLPEVEELLRDAAQRYQARAKSIGHPGGRR